MATVINYANGLYNSELIAMCTSCKSKDCPEGICVRYRQKYRELYGYKPITRNMHDGTHRGRKPHERFEYRGEIHSITEWARILGINAATLHSRIRKSGMTFAEAAEYVKPECKWAGKFECNGVSKTLTQWSREIGIPRDTIIYRLKRGIPIEEALRR